MEIVSRRKQFMFNLSAGLRRFFTLSIAFLLLLVITRIFEYFYLGQKMTLPVNSSELYLYGLWYDLFLFFILSGCLLIPYLIIYLIHRSLAGLLYGLLAIFFILSEVGLIMYFATTSLLLGTDLFGYTFDEIIKIAASSGGFSITNIIVFAIGILLMSAILFNSKRIKINLTLALIFCSISLGSLFFKDYSKPKTTDYKTELEFNLIINKAYYLGDASYYKMYPKEHTEASLYNYFYTGVFTEGKSFEFVSQEFPFLRKDNTPDVLGKHFNIGTKQPNLVFLIVESLGRGYSGDGAALKSFTPFLDSLMMHSLYWENMLSTASRTFEVLPSVFGSMPYGISGFAELGDDMPEGLTLINLLTQRGYVSRFFYGGDASFDNMKLFLTKQNIDYIVEEKDFGLTYKKMPANSGNFTWGYGDKDIFRRGFESLAKADTTPRLDIYLTLAMHDPYKINDQEYYNKKAEERFKSLQLSESVVAENKKYLQNFATILYFDDALKYFFEEYKKREDYSNTIFFITGDHRMSTPPIRTQIDRYHVPFVVFSPMLKKGAKFSSVVSHLDITPSVVAFMKANYGMKFPGIVPWIGQGLDSVKEFRVSMSTPFIRNKSEMIDYIDHDYYIANNQIFKLDENMGLGEVKNDQKLVEIQRKFEKFKSDNIKATVNKRLIPDSLFVKRKQAR